MSFFVGLVNASVKVTGWLPQRLVFRLKVHYEDKKVQSRHISGKAIIISNHTSVYDYAAMLFVFFWRTLRYQMAEVLFRKGLGVFLKAMGGIYIDRNSHNFSFMEKSEKILKHNGVVGVFPESRLKREGESGILPFMPSVAALALSSGAPVIPVYTDGNYFGKGRAHVIVGKPIDVRSMYSDDLTEKENTAAITERLREKIIMLGELLDEQKG